MDTGGRSSARCPGRDGRYDIALTYADQGAVAEARAYAEAAVSAASISTGTPRGTCMIPLWKTR